jgi:two-component system response regulator FixJ
LSVTKPDPYLAIVDDEGPVCTALGRVLRLAGYDVAAFASGAEFLDSLGARRPDCVILDVHMPLLSGFDVQSKLRAARIDLRVIFITAIDACGLEREALDAGGHSLLLKPFSDDDLLAAVDAALYTSDASRRAGDTCRPRD